jgi:hypothetical protein
MEILEYFVHRFKYVEYVFDHELTDNDQKDANTILKEVKVDLSLKAALRGLMKEKKKVGTDTLKIINKNNYSCCQASIIRLFYWAGFFGLTSLVELFIEKLGLSPFLKLYQ